MERGYRAKRSDDSLLVWLWQGGPTSTATGSDCVRQNAGKNSTTRTSDSWNQTSRRRPFATPSRETYRTRSSFFSPGQGLPNHLTKLSSRLITRRSDTPCRCRCHKEGAVQVGESFTTLGTESQKLHKRGLGITVCAFFLLCSKDKEGGGNNAFVAPPQRLPHELEAEDGH